MQLSKLVLLLVAGLVLVGYGMAAPVEVTGTVPSLTQFIQPAAGSLGTLSPEASPVTKADSFSVKCNGAYVVTATAQPTWMAANGHMQEWDTQLLIFPANGHQLQKSLHLIGTGPSAFGDKDLAVIGTQLATGTGTALKTYNFNWAQEVTWEDYPDTPYNLKVEFALTRVP
jgi:hypothetical protein